MNTPLITSTRRIILFLELATFIFISVQSNFNAAVMLMALSISFIHASLYIIGKSNFSQFLTYGLLISFGLILYFDFNNPIRVSFAGYIVSLAFFTFFMVKNTVVKYIYSISF